MGAPGTKTKEWKWYYDYGFYPVEGGKYEAYFTEEEQTGNRFAHRDHAINILVKWSVMSYGMILMWWRPIADIPEGWHLCDGTDGFPDLRDKFILGASSAHEPCTEKQTNIDAGAVDYAHYMVFIAKTLPE